MKISFNLPKSIQFMVLILFLNINSDSYAGQLTLTIKISDTTLNVINREDCTSDIAIPIDWTTDQEPPSNNTYQFYVGNTSDCNFSSDTNVLLEGTLPSTLGGLFDNDITAGMLIDEIADESCGGSDGVEGTLYICMRILDDSDQEIAKAGAKIDYDTIIPPAPTEISISSGDSNAQISWNWEGSDTLSGYNIYWDTQSHNGELSNYPNAASTTSTSYQIKDLQNGTEVFVVVTAVDDAGNESDPSEEVSTTPQPSLDFWEYYKESNGTENGGYCFVYTLSFGPDARFILPTMREFRDRILNHFEAGKWFIKEYYSKGPLLVNALLLNPFLILLLKPALFIITIFAFITLHPFISTTIFMFSIFFIVRRKK